MIQLYLLILIIIFLLNYFYNENRELFGPIPVNLITASNDSSGIKISWIKDGETADSNDIITSHNYYLTITNTNNNLTSIKKISPTLINDVISYSWTSSDSDGGPQDNNIYDLTINRIPTDQENDHPKAYNTIRITRKADTTTTEDINYDCKYDTVQSDFFNNLKGKKFHIHI